MPQLRADIVDPRRQGATGDRHELASLIGGDGDFPSPLPPRLPNGSRLTLADREDAGALFLLESSDALTLVSWVRERGSWREAWAWSVSGRDVAWRRHLDDPDGVYPTAAHHPRLPQARWLHWRPQHRLAVLTWASADETADGPEFRYVLLAADGDDGTRREVASGEIVLNAGSDDPAAGPVSIDADGLRFDGRPVGIPMSVVGIDRLEFTLPFGLLLLGDAWVPAPLTFALDHRGLATPIPERHPLSLVAHRLAELRIDSAAGPWAAEGFVDACAPRTRRFAIAIYPPPAEGTARIEVERGASGWAIVPPSNLAATRPVDRCPAGTGWNYPYVGPTR